MIQMIKDLAIVLIQTHKGLTHSRLEIKIIATYPAVTDQQINQAISELVQSNEIKRIEYQMDDNRSMFLSFYLPGGSRLV